jgi:adenosylcobinamide-GDP ribazoletransferase
MSAFLAAVQFLLVSPAFVRREFHARELGGAVGFYPLVGLLLGALLVAADGLLARLFPLEVRSALILGLWILLTGALHFDGLLDSCDGLLGGHTAVRRMQIMRDERTGAFALAAGTLMLLIVYSALNALGDGRWPALLLAPVLGRCGMAVAVTIYPYARAEGLGRDIKDHAGALQSAEAALTAIAVVAGLTWLLRSPAPAVSLLTAAGVWWLGARFILHRIPGMTGDTYGALNMLVEATVLVTWVGMR